jgi:predicted metal-dependent hydrolase
MTIRPTSTDDKDMHMDMHDIAIRKMGFEFPADLDLVFLPDDPELSYTFVGTWFMLPYLEPYLIRSINAAIDKVSSPEQQEEMRRFVQQEAHHYRQHAKANNIIRQRKPAYAALKALEDELNAEYQRFSKEKPLLFNLAYAEGFECMTAAAASVQIELGMFEEPGHPLRELALWHVMEEIEHRNVAFEAYRAAGGGYLYRLFVGLWAQAHFLGWGKRLTQVLKDADPEVFARYDTPECKARMRAMRKRYFRAVLPRWLAIYMPWYSPRKIPLTAKFEAVRRRFSDAATSIS